MGGKASKNTKPDMRLKENQAKYGSVANRDAGRQTVTPQKPAKEQKPASKKG